MVSYRRWAWLGGGFLLWIVPGWLVSCSTEELQGGSRAQEVKNRSVLIGGPMAMGDLGDFLLENNRIRAVISKAGISRAFGLFGGNLVDADRVRGGLGRGTAAGGRGFDSLVEFFPLFFLGVVDTDASKIINDGKDGSPAQVRVTGQGASFIALTEQINNLLIFMGGKNRLHFQMDYILEAGKEYVKLVVTIINRDESGYGYQDFGGVVPAVNGVIGLFGKRNTVFIPGLAGYNLRFSLEEVFKTRLSAPALPGLIGDFVGSRGENGVSYGIVAEASDKNYVHVNRKEFEKLQQAGKPQVPLSTGSVIVPLEGSSITGCFTKTAPTVLQPEESFSYTLYLVIGDGSVSSIRDAQLEIHKKPYGTLTGQVLEEDTLQPIEEAHAIAFVGDEKATKPGERVFYTDMITDRRGSFQGRLEPGTYKVIARTRNLKSRVVEVQVKAGEAAFARLLLPREGVVAFTIRDTLGRAIPAKASALRKVSDIDQGRCVGQDPNGCLYDLHIGQHPLETDFRAGWTCSDGKICRGASDCKGVGDGTCHYRLKADTEVREALAVSPNGQGVLRVRPGNYRIVASRGIEYELADATVTISPGEVKTVEIVLRHSVPTPTMISADLHVHTNLSHDVRIPDDQQVISFAAEGVDYFVPTDHNRIRDMQPLVLALRLEEWLKTGIGVELTTFEMGHFNAFPIVLDPAQFHGGNPDWFKKDERYKDDTGFPIGSSRPLTGLREGYAPPELFDSLRKRGSLSPDRTIIQVNHPRDSIFGYFNTYKISADDAFPVYSTGLSSPVSREFDIDKYEPRFDALEIFNGKLLDLIWSWRIPPDQPAPTGYGGGPGTLIRLDNGGKADVAYPGGADDWFNMLNRGIVYTATANSDSHGFDSEPGSPRNYLLTGSDKPNEMTDEVLSDTIKKRKVMLTNGPILEVEAAESTAGPWKGIGETLSTSKKEILLRIRVQAPSWIDVSEILVYQNGKIVRSIPLPESKEIERFSFQKPLTFDVSEGDAWFVVTAKGTRKDLWPVVVPAEIEPFQIGQAVSLIQDTLLASFPIPLNLSSDACLIPSKARLILPYAISNPIWIDTDGDGAYTPNPCKTLGEKGVTCRKAGTSCKQGTCVEESRSCKKDDECGPLGRCIAGSCRVDPCDGLTCSPAFQACSATNACADDTCLPQNRTCKDGTSCQKDSDCAGKADGLCRYCACPPPRKACSDGAICQDASECKSGTCEERRFCFPTGCALGRCLPTYPTCDAPNARKDTHLFLQHSEAAPFSSQTQRASLLQMRHFYKTTPLDPSIQKDDRFTIKRAAPYFLFFEHTHH